MTRGGGGLPALLALAIGAALGGGCRRGAGPEVRPAAEPSSALNAGARASDGAPGAPTEGAADDLEAGVPRLAVVLDDPRLAFAKERDQAGDSAAAAREVDRVRAAVSLDPGAACAWSYVAGRLHLAAGEAAEAAAAFDAAARRPDGGAACAIAPYASLRQAQALVRLARHDDAIALLRDLGDLGTRDETKLLLCDASVGKGDRAAAVAIWRDLLAASPHGLRWVDTSMQLAAALLDGVDGPPESHADEALDLVTRVVVEAPMAAEKLNATALRTRAALLAKRLAPPALTPDERARQAQAWLDASQPKRAREAAADLLKALPRADKKHRAASCKAAIVRAQATPHGHPGDAADAWGEAIARCEGDDALVTALYYGAKASSSAKRNAEAIARFDKVEKLFPKHRLADDARLRAALVAGDDGDEARSLAMLASVPDAYPDGDIAGEALFRVALVSLGKRDLDGARAALDRALTLAESASHAGSALAGRFDYFRARVAQLTGEIDDAKRRYVALVADQPLSYYMLLAYSRLRGLDPALARSTLDTAVAREPAAPFLTREHAELASDVFQRFQGLLEVGELQEARHEASAGGLLADGVDPEVVWVVASLYDRAGAPETGHALARSRLVDYRSHWPAGRWRFAWRAAFPRPWDEAVVRESEAARIPVALTWAVMREESSFIPDAHSVANAIGLMQLVAGTARKVAAGTPLPADEASLERPEVSIALGTRLLSSLRASFPTTPALAIAAYNGGTRAVRRWIAERGGDDFDVFVERVPFDETRAYVKRVLASEAAYAYLYAPDVLEELWSLVPAAPGTQVATGAALASPDK